MGNKPSSLCPSDQHDRYDPGLPIVGSVSFKRLTLIISWISFGITVLLWLALIIPHLRRYNAPNEQRQIFRLIATPLMYSIFGIASIYATKAAVYLEPVPQLYEAYALASLFLLYVYYVAPEAHTRDEFFHNLEDISKGHGKPGHGLRWFRRTWRIVFVYILLYTFLFILKEIFVATGRYCSGSAHAKHGHIWITTIELILTIVALIVIIRFQRRLKSYMQGRRALMKLISFKLFVAITTIQNFIFGILKTQVTGNDTMTYQDITLGLPVLLLCIEGMIFMGSFHVSFHSRDYRSHMDSARPFSSIFTSLAHVLNPYDLIKGVGLAFTHLRAKKHVPMADDVSKQPTVSVTGE